MSQQYNDPNQPGGYQPGGYQPNPGMNPNMAQGQSLAQTSMILGILSLFVVGFVLGPIAIVKAKRAEELGGDAKVGKITGWIGAVLGVLGLILFIIYIVAILAFLPSMTY